MTAQQVEGQWTPPETHSYPRQQRRARGVVPVASRTHLHAHPESARIAALTRWSREDPRGNAERGQAGLQRKFYDATDPSLPEAERQRRAHAAYRRT